MATRSTRGHSVHEANALSASAMNAWMELPRRQLAMLVAMQADAVRFSVQQATHYWSEVANSMLKWQADMLSRASEEIIERGAEPTFESFQRAFEATLNGKSAGATTH
jgi:hypothetical protein